MTGSLTQEDSHRPSADVTAFALAAAAFLIHLAANPHYGFFRDELYFIVCGRHPDFGYVDQPPLVPLLAAGSQVVGTSLFLLRSVPALFAAAMTYTVCALAGDMGGGRFARVLAGAAAALSTVLLAFSVKLGPDTVQIWLWPLAVLFAGRALHRSPAWWLAAGAALGVAGEAKYSAIIAASALLTGIALTPHRRAFVTSWFWGGILVAGLILLPNALWQWQHGLPMLELLRNGQHGKNVMLSPVSFLLQQVLLTNPPLALIWLAGLAWCLARPAWRWLGLGLCALLAVMIVLHGKAYYPGPIYPALFAAGGVAIERLLRERPRLRGATLAGAVLSGFALAPIILPVLPEPAMASYLAFLTGAGAGMPATEHLRPAVLGQDFADMHGWQELAGQVTRLYQGLPADVRAKTYVFASNYGEAAAIDVLAPPGVLPPVLSGHNQYWLWGPRGFDGSAVLDVGGDLAADQKLCGSAVIAGVFSEPYVMPYENGIAIILCRNVRVGGQALWTSLKHYD